MSEAKCPACGEEIRLGDYPFCPHRSTRTPSVLSEPELPSDASIRKAAAICADVSIVDGRCVYCGNEIHIGDYPFCPHDSIYHTRAQRFDPIILHQDAATGTYRFPASTDAPVPAGYRKIEVRTIQEADRISREVNHQEDQSLRAFQYHTESQRLEMRAQNRAVMDYIRAGGPWVTRDEHGRKVVRHGLSPQAEKFMDRARAHIAEKDQRRANSQPRSTNFHFDVFAHDSSNREQYADERTRWKRRKG